MAVFNYRSPNAELKEGATDGKYRKVRPNTTVAPGTGETDTLGNRRGLHADYNYGYITAETGAKVNPGGSR